jgi:hypothetical protein
VIRGLNSAKYLTEEGLTTIYSKLLASDTVLWKMVLWEIKIN